MRLLWKHKRNYRSVRNSLCLFAVQLEGIVDRIFSHFRGKVYLFSGTRNKWKILELQQVLILGLLVFPSELKQTANSKLRVELGFVCNTFINANNNLNWRQGSFQELSCCWKSLIPVECCSFLVWQIIFLFECSQSFSSTSSTLDCNSQTRARSIVKVNFTEQWSLHFLWKSFRETVEAFQNKAMLCWLSVSVYKRLLSNFAKPQEKSSAHLQQGTGSSSFVFSTLHRTWFICWLKCNGFEIQKKHVSCETLLSSNWFKAKDEEAIAEVQQLYSLKIPSQQEQSFVYMIWLQRVIAAQLIANCETKLFPV